MLVGGGIFRMPDPQRLEVEKVAGHRALRARLLYARVQRSDPRSGRYLWIEVVDDVLDVLLSLATLAKCCSNVVTTLLIEASDPFAAIRSQPPPFMIRTLTLVAPVSCVLY